MSSSVELEPFTPQIATSFRNNDLSTKETKQLVALANAYTAAMDTYSQSKEGAEELKARYALQASYLSCVASDTKIQSAVYSEKELDKDLANRITKEWMHKVKNKLLEKNEHPTVTLEMFITQAKHYNQILVKTKAFQIFQKQNKAQTAFKKHTFFYLMKGVTNRTLNGILRGNGIKDERVLI